MNHIPEWWKIWLTLAAPRNPLRLHYSRPCSATVRHTAQTNLIKFAILCGVDMDDKSAALWMVDVESSVAGFWTVGIGRSPSTTSDRWWNKYWSKAEIVSQSAANYLVYWVRSTEKKISSNYEANRFLVPVRNKMIEHHSFLERFFYYPFPTTSMLHFLTSKAKALGGPWVNL